MLQLYCFVWANVFNVVQISPEFWGKIEKTIFGVEEDPHDSWRPALNSIAHVMDGLCDLKVPHMVVVVEEVRRNEHLGSSIVTLKDASGVMEGILWDGDASFLSTGLDFTIRSGSAVYLQNVPILVQRSPFARYLVLHRSSVRRVVALPSVFNPEGQTTPN